MGTIDFDAEKSRRLPESLAAYAPQALIGLNPLGFIVEWPEEFQKIFGWRSTDVLGKRLFTIILPPPHLPPSEIASGIRQRVTAIRRDGSILTIELSKVQPPAGAAASVYYLVRDITGDLQRDQVQSENEAEARAVINAAPLGICSVDVEGRFIRVNPEFCRMLGYSENELLQLNFADVTHVNDRAADVAALRSMQTGELESYKREKRYVRRDGRILWVDLTSSVLKNPQGKIRGTITIVKDITICKRAEAQLKSAKEATESAQRLKSFFLANISHEIRTPLGAILGFSELLKDPVLSHKDRDLYLDIMDRSGKSLTRIIDDTLDLSRLEAGVLSLKREPVKIQDIIRDVLDLLSAEAAKKNLTLSFRIEPGSNDFLYSDPSRLRQILSNLVGNAIKFTRNGEVSVKLTPQPRQEIGVLVEDTGIGISAEQAGRLFQPFSPMDSSHTRTFGGAGVGLALSRRLAQALGGDIALLKSSPCGSTFLFTHPLAAVHLAISSHFSRPSLLPPLSVEKSLAGLKILVVDDVEENQLLMDRMLKSRGAKPDFALNGQEAIQKALSLKFDLVLMDMQMPVLDGYKATAELRRQGFEKPIIAVTAHTLKDEIQECLDAGCNAHLSKPVSLARLVRIVLSCQLRNL